MITSYESPMAARAAIMSFLVAYGAGLDAPVLEKTLELANAPSPVDQIVKVAEYLYANAADLGAEARDLAGSLASYASENYWHGMDVEARGNRIALAMRRENGEDAPEGSSFPDAEDDPVPMSF